MNAFDVKSIVDLSKPFGFDGDSNKCDIRNGYGKEYWKSDQIQKYQGLYHENSLHGAGKYHWGQVCYEGKIYANNIHGYGIFSYTDGSYFEGLFKNNQRYGPGVYTYADSTQDVGLWMGNKLIRLSTKLTDCVPRITKNIKGRAYLNKYKNLIPISKPFPPTNVVLDELNASNLINDAHLLYNNNIRYSKCLFFNVESYDQVFNQTVKVVRSFQNDIPLIKEDEVTELLAWNNEEDLMELRKYIFFHRNFEKELSYDVESILETRELFSPKGILERNCEELFISTCNGDNRVQNLIINFDLNPDVCDKLGNTAVHCAVSKNNIPALSNLVNYGANLDRLNDECLTPLLICLLRYIEERDKINNWQDSFLPPRESAELSSYIFDISCKFVQFPDKKQKVKKTKQKKVKPKKEKKGKSKKEKEIEELQPEPSVKVEIDPEVLALVEKLSKIRKTISTLLRYGTNPNVGEVPLPPLFVSLFTFNDEIVNELLKHKANINLRNSYQDGFLTPLHVVASMKPQPELLKLARVLLENGADPHLRANAIHWNEETCILGLDNCPDEGKTALHLLSMRYDYLLDEADYLGSLYDVMIELGCDPNLLYLGHTCLSLAVLRGNLKLIDRMLKTYKIDPNQYLGCEMGVPLTVLILKRYKNHLPLYACKDVFDILTKYNANPFNSCSKSFNLNAIEFCEDENQPDKSRGKTKVNKKESHYKITLALKKTAEVALNKHIMAKVIKTLFYYKIICEFKHPIFDIIVQFLDIKETQRILQLLIDNNEVQFMPEEIMTLLSFVESKSFSKSSRKTAKSSIKSNSDPLEYFVNSLQKQDLELKEIYVPEPEIDLVEDKYIVCYNCFKKEGKTLVLCPRCELVYFCSVQCNNANLKKKQSRHKCKGIFYIEELKKQIDGNNKTSALQELEFDLRSLMIGVSTDTNDLLKELAKEKMRIKELSDTDKTFNSKKAKDKTGKDKKDKSDKTSESTEILEKKKKTKIDKSDHEEDDKSSKIKSEKRGKTKKSKKDKSVNKSESKENLEKKKKTKKDRTDRENEKSSKTKQEKGGKTRHKKIDEGEEKSSKVKSEQEGKAERKKTDKEDEKYSETRPEKGEKAKRKKTNKEEDKSSKSKSEERETAKRKKTDKGDEQSRSKSNVPEKDKAVKQQKAKKDKSDKIEKSLARKEKDKREKSTSREEKDKRSKAREEKDKREKIKAREEHDKIEKSVSRKEKDIMNKSKARDEIDKREKSKAEEETDQREKSPGKGNDAMLTGSLDQTLQELKDKVQTDKLDAEKMESLGEKLDITKLTSSFEYIFNLNEKYLPCVVLINGQLYYKFKKYGAYCNINYSSL